MASHASGPTVTAPAADLPDWALRAVDLANPRLGAKTLAASDDFFAEASRMLNPEPAQFCLLYTSPSPRDRTRSRMPSSA